MIEHPGTSFCSTQRVLTKTTSLPFSSCIKAHNINILEIDEQLSYHFTCCLGRDVRGKQIRRYSTWIAPEGITPSKARKIAEKAAAAWEQQMRAAFEKDLRNPERAKIKELDNDKLDFSLFITEIWFPIQMENLE